MVISFALNAVYISEAALNNINDPIGMASLDKIEENKITNDAEPILIKNGTMWQLRKLKLK